MIQALPASVNFSSDCYGHYGEQHPHNDPAGKQFDGFLMMFFDPILKHNNNT
jgi:hypothetical protein